ncbi:ABC transporter substrate-binding protein [Thermodesulfovibrionales bacterium]|nr:ABC transporter substrate-binding protein [Thermodesulfovibrionales bacterium]
MKMNKKVAGLVICLLLLGVVLAVYITQQAEEAKVVRQELTVGISTDVEHWFLDKFPGGDARFVWSQIYETLVRVDPDLKIQPGLAESWETPDDGKTWLFHLREGISFHDGTSFNAAAVVFSYGDGAFVRTTVLRAVEYVEAVDEHTVKFVLKRPMPLPLYLTHVAWPVMSPTSVDDQGEFVKPVGTGPFKFDHQVDEQKIVLVRNDAYWGEKPALEKVTFRVVPDATTRVMALERQEVDMIIKVPEAEVSRLEVEPDIVVYRRLTTFTDFLQFNCQRTPFNDLAVRMAVAYAVDTEQIVANVLEGIGEPAKGRPFSPIMMYANPDLDLYEANVERSKKLLSAAGWQDIDGDGLREKDGEVLKTTLLLARGAWAPRHASIAEVVQGALREVGMEVDIQLLDGGAMRKLETAGDFDIILRTGFFVWGPYPRHFFIHHSNSPWGHFGDEEYDQLVDAADMTVDPEKQRQLYYELQDMVIERLPAFYLVHEEKIVAANAYVQGYTMTAEAPWLNLDGVYTAERK